MRKDTVQWLVPVVLAIAVAGALWFYWAHTHGPARGIGQEPSPPVEAPAPEAPAEPAHPLPQAPEPAAPEAKLRPLPPLDRSDEYFKIELTDLFGKPLDKLLVNSRLIERIVATVDNLPRDHVAQRIRPLNSVEGKFIVQKEDEGNLENPVYVLSPENYRRYDALVGMISSTDMNEIVDVYRRFYPLMQKAYADLGYPNGYFNDRVVEVIDHLLATPDVAGPIRLVQPNVLYEFADPQLETLSSGQKVLLRMGEKNAAIVKQKLREFRQRITEK